MLEEAEKELTLVAERAHLAESVEGVRSILLFMYRFPSLKNKKLSQKTGIAIPTLAAVRGELVKAGILEKRNFLGEKGREWVKSNLSLNFEYDPLPGNFDSIIREIPEEFSYFNPANYEVHNLIFYYKKSYKKLTFSLQNEFFYIGKEDTINDRIYLEVQYAFNKDVLWSLSGYFTDTLNKGKADATYTDYMVRTGIKVKF